MSDWYASRVIPVHSLRRSACVCADDETSNQSARARACAYPRTARVLDAYGPRAYARGSDRGAVLKSRGREHAVRRSSAMHTSCLGACSDITGLTVREGVSSLYWFFQHFIPGLVIPAPSVPLGRLTCMDGARSGNVGERRGTPSLTVGPVMDIRGTRCTRKRWDATDSEVEH